MLLSQIDNINTIYENDSYITQERICDEDKYIYQGEIDEESKYSGFGKLWSNKYKYSGNFLNFNFHGYGELEYNESENNVKYYHGEYINGKKHGKGTEKFTNGEYYIGNFSNGLRHGNGILYNSNGIIKIEGIWSKGKSIDTTKITEYYDNGNLKYKGNYNGLNYEGKGILCNQDGDLVFEGEFHDDKYHSGKYYNKNFIIFEGIFGDGVDIDFNIPSEGTFYHENGILFTKGKVKKLNNDYYLVGNDDIFNNNGNKIYKGKFNYLDNPIIVLNIILNFTEDINIKIYPTGGKVYYSHNDPNPNNLIIKTEFNLDDNNQLNGMYKTFYKNGNIEFEYPYVNGKPNGEQIARFENGKIQSTVNIIDNKKEGIKQCYKIINNNHYLEKAINYVNNIITELTIYYSNGNIQIKGPSTSDDFPGFNGNAIEYYDNNSNSIKYEGNWQNGKYNGQGVLRYQNGNKNYEGDWVDGKKTGLGTLFYEGTGTLQYTGAWVSDEMHGDGTIFNDTGDVVYSGNFQYNEIYFNG